MTRSVPRKDHRYIIKRIIIRGNLVLETPTCLGNGDRDSLTDLALLRDSMSDRALLTGASLAGALRNYLHERQCSYGKYDERHTLSAMLFGDLSLYENEKNLLEANRQELQDSSNQSPLVVNDSISNTVPEVELRDGVKINGTTGTADDQAKYDYELLVAGTTFPLLLELLIEQGQDEIELKRALAIALQGLEKEEIAIGMKKRRGFGCCKVASWQVWEFNLQNPAQCRAWLHYDHWTPELIGNYPKQPSITDALNVALDEEDDRRDRLTITATFNLASSILIRSGHAETNRAPDVVHLKSHRNGGLKPVVSGTSLAGVLRHRAERIVNTLQQSTQIIDEMFGPDFTEDRSKKPKASRLIVHENVIENATEKNELVQTRIAIDRFTGGAYPGALFQEQPVFASAETCIKVELELRKPQPHEIGLLLLLIKDLWTEDLPVGGSSSIGRGRLKGKETTITWHCSNLKQQWKIEQIDDCQLEIRDLQDSSQPKDAVKQQLEVFVNALYTYVAQEEKP